LTAFFGSSGGRAGGAGSGNTGAPGDGVTCGVCHVSGASNYGVPTISVSVATTLGGAAITEYMPGQEYFVTTTVSAPMGSPGGYGFQSVYLDNMNANTGTLTAIAGEPTTQIAAAGSRNYAEHSGIDADGVFRFKWTAPAQSTGPVTIYTVGNAVNATGGTGGDSGTPTPTVITLTEQALPVELTNIQARTEKSEVEITWTTATEDNVSHFEVERSIEGEEENFNLIGQVSAQGFSQSVQNYQHSDETATAGLNYYRLKMVDLDGTYAYSPVVSATAEVQNVRLGAYPNPTQAIVQFSNNVAQETALLLRDGFGRQLWSGKAADGLDLSSYPSGVYLLEGVIDGKRTIERVVKQ